MNEKISLRSGSAVTDNDRGYLEQVIAHDRVIMLYWKNADIEIRPGRCSITSELTAKDAFSVIMEALREDPDYFRSWKDNIAMAFKDEYARRPIGERNTKQAIHEIANQAAVNFLNLLMRKG